MVYFTHVLSIISALQTKFQSDPVNDKNNAQGVVVDFAGADRGHRVGSANGRQGDYGKGTGGNEVGFGLFVDEVSVGDLLQCGDEFRVAEVLVYAEGRNRARIRYIKTSGAMWDTTAGRPWYRVTVAKEIREALLALPMERLRDVTVKPRWRSSGRRQSELVNTETENSRATFPNALQSPSSSGDAIAVGDYVRVGNEVRMLRAVITADKSFRIQPFFLKSSLASAYKFTGMTYEISFSPACRSHADCRWNGINQHDSDSGSNHVYTGNHSPEFGGKTGVHSGANRGRGGDWMSEGDGEDDGATCHAGGSCVCSDPAVYTGTGCTRQGIAGHSVETGRHSGRRLPGDIPLLDCDVRDMWSGQTLPWTAHGECFCG